MRYEAADKAIKEMNRANLKAFGRLKMAKWDELNVIRDVQAVYAASIRMAKRKYLRVYRDAYYEFLLEYGFTEAAARRMTDKVSDDWLIEFLEEADPVTLYAFLPEADRKMWRLIEALAVATDKRREIDKALRYWTFQVGQYADNALILGRIRAMKAAGVQMVRWRTQEDERVCEDCEPLDNRVFPINAMPQLPAHPRCRCWCESA